MESWQYEPASDLHHSLREQLQRFPREPGLITYSLRGGCALVLRTWMTVYHRLTIRGREHLPNQGSFVLIANHSSHLDALCLLMAVPVKKLHCTFPAAARDYFFSSLPRSLFAATFVNALPFDRQLKGSQSLAVCRALLDQPGNILILFPEGTRSQDGNLQIFKSGIGRLLAGSTTPVLPCRLDGCFEAFGKGKYWPRPKSITLSIGAPLSFSDFRQEKTDVRRICDLLSEQVASLKRIGP